MSLTTLSWPRKASSTGYGSARTAPPEIDASQTKLELGDVRIQCGEDARERARKELVVRVEKSRNGARVLANP